MPVLPRFFVRQKNHFHQLGLCRTLRRVSFDASELKATARMFGTPKSTSDGGHLASDTAADEIASLVSDFMASLPAKLKARRAS